MGTVTGLRQPRVRSRQLQSRQTHIILTSLPPLSDAVGECAAGLFILEEFHKPSRIEIDRCRHGPLTGQVYFFFRWLPLHVQ